MSKTGMVVVGIVAAGLWFVAASPAQAQSNGEKVYKAKCAGCHAADGSGNSPAGKAMKARDYCSEDVKKETDAEMTDIVLKGKNKMPAFQGKISDADVKDVVEFVQSLCKKK